MKKQIASLAILLFCAAGVQAEEQISSISFNPSRLGLFEQLRLTEGMTSRGNVTVSNVFLIRKNTTLTTKDGLTVNKDIDAQRGRVDIPATDLQINSGGSPSLEVTGGYAQFLNDSRIGSLPTNTWIRSPQMNLGTLTITGGPGMLFDNDAYANGLVLGGNDIPLIPSDCPDGALAWVNRKDSSGSTYQVLGVTGCPATNEVCSPSGAPETKECTAASYSVITGKITYGTTTQSQVWSTTECKWVWSLGACCNPGNNYCANSSSCSVFTTSWKYLNSWKGIRDNGGTGNCQYTQDYANASNRVMSRPTAGATCSPYDASVIYMTNDQNCTVENWYCTKNCQN